MSEQAEPRPGGNGFDPAVVSGFVQRIESLGDDLLTERSEYMTRCKSIRGDIKLVLDEAKDAGIPRKELKLAVKTRELQRKVDAIREDLEGDEQDNYDMIRHALGDLADTPLGAAALKPKRRRQRSSEEQKTEDAAAFDQPQTQEAPAFSG